VAVFWHELVDVDARVEILNGFRGILPTTVIALMLCLLNCNLNFLRQVQMNECVHSTSILLEHFSFLYDSWEVSQDEAVSGGIGNPQQLNCQLILNLLINIASVKHVLGLNEEWV